MSFCRAPFEEPEALIGIAGMIVGRSAAMQNVAALVRQIAVYPTTTVLLQGESGTGKDVVARSVIHELSRRACLSVC